MKAGSFVSTLSLLLVTASLQAQPTPHSTPEQRAKAKAKTEYSLFRREITALKEFAQEKGKIGALQKENKVKVQVVATIDSVEIDDDKTKTLTGYITQIVGDNTANAYEIVFDRATHKITSVKRTTEAIEPEAAEAKPAAKKPATTKPGTKKKEGDDEEDDEKEEKRTGTKEKEEE